MVVEVVLGRAVEAGHVVSVVVSVLVTVVVMMLARRCKREPGLLGFARARPPKSAVVRKM
jgi:hypothetical protein